jgi:hypothetical protein
MGLWIGLVVALAFFAGLTSMLTTATEERLPGGTSGDAIRACRKAPSWATR